MAINKVAAAYLAYFAYIDDGLEIVDPTDFERLLQAVPPGAANGPWTLAWGPAVNDGILAYVARGADGSYGLAFRGTNTDTAVTGWFQNLLVDFEAFALVPWLYPQGGSPAMALSEGTNQALALAMGLTDPATDASLLDFLRGLSRAAPLDLLVSGHSLGGAITIAATGWLHDQLPKAGAASFSLAAHTFAAPTVWNSGFAGWFPKTFPYYGAANANDIVPMAWNNLAGILGTFPPPGPNLLQTDTLIYGLVLAASKVVPQYAAIAPTDPFTIAPEANQTWPEEASLMHSMQFQYFPHATGTKAPDLPNTSSGGLARPSAAAPRQITL